MKVAVCLSGALRSFKEIYPSLYKNIIKPFDADIFMHCWVKEKKFSKKQYKRGKNIPCGFKWLKDKTKISDINELCTPKKQIIEVYNEEAFNKIKTQYGLDDIFDNLKKKLETETDKRKIEKKMMYLSNSIGMYHKIFMVNELKKEYENENGFIYDIVIRCRPDFMYESLLKKETLDLILSNKNKENLIMKVMDKYACGKKLSNDKFSIGTSCVMDKYCNLINYLKKYSLDNPGLKLEGQILDKLHVNSLKLKIIWIDFLYERNDRPGNTKMTNGQRKLLKINSETNHIYQYKKKKL